MKTICIDSGLMIAMYNPRDENHSKAKSYFNDYFSDERNKMLVPWPILYETVRTKTVRDRKQMSILMRDWKRLVIQNQLILIDDSEFRERALEECFTEIKRDPLHYRSLSLVDRVIRNILMEVNIRIDYFITFNSGDFADVCRRYNRVIIQ